MSSNLKQTYNSLIVNDISKRFEIGRNIHTTFSATIHEWFSRRKKEKEHIWALEDISFNVEKGKVLGIIGENGAGKSTLLKILSKITSPTSGNAIINGKVSSLLEVGTGFHPELTGRENIFLNGALLGMNRQEIKLKFDDIAEFSGIEKFIDTPIKKYSSGMYTRLAFSIAAHLESDILLIDEVLAVGDFKFQQKCLSKMDDISNQGKTIVYVSHNLNSVKNLCHQVILLEKGKIKTKGHPNEVIEEYLNKQSLSKRFSSILFEKILIRTENQKNQILTDEDLIIEFKIKETLKTESLIVRIEVFNLFNQLLFICNNRISGEKLILVKNNSIKCKVEELPLLSGEYYIRYKILDGIHLIEEISDKIYFYVTQKNTALEPFEKRGIKVHYNYSIG